jgi:hypothetical protein
MARSMNQASLPAERARSPSKPGSEAAAATPSRRPLLVPTLRVGTHLMDALRPHCSSATQSVAPARSHAKAWEREGAWAPFHANHPTLSTYPTV